MHPVTDACILTGTTIDGKRLPARENFAANLIYSIGPEGYVTSKNLFGPTNDNLIPLVLDILTRDFLRIPPLRFHHACLREGWRVASAKDSKVWVGFREKTEGRITFFWPGELGEELAALTKEDFFAHFTELHPDAPEEAQPELLTLVDRGEHLAGEQSLVVTPEGSLA